MIDAGKLRACLVDQWGLAGPTVEVHNGGMNSATWFVSEAGERWVAKAVVPESRRSFAGGLAVAGHVEAGGIRAGAPVPTRQGNLVADVDGVPVALLTRVAGDGLQSTGPDEQRLIGSTWLVCTRRWPTCPAMTPNGSIGWTRERHTWRSGPGSGRR